VWSSPEEAEYPIPRLMAGLNNGNDLVRWLKSRDDLTRYAN